MLEYLGYFGVYSAAVYFALHLLKTFASILFFKLRPERRKPMTSLAVLTPIVSGDPNLEDNLKQHLSVLPADSQIFWILDESDEEAKLVMKEVLQSTQRTVTVLESPEIPGDFNPKAFKMQLAYPLIEKDYVCVLDDDTMPTTETLEAAVGALERAEVYTGLPCYLRGPNFWSDLICHFVANNGIATYLATQCFGPPVSLNGMFYILKSSTLRGYGGFELIYPYLCDDYAFARVVKERGGLIHQSTLPHAIRTHASSSQAYFRLLHRWFAMATVLFRDQPIRLQAMILILLALPPFLLWFSLLSPMLSPYGWLVFPALVSVRFLLIRLQHWVVLPHRYPINFVTSIVSEVLQPVHAIHAAVSQQFYWRKRLIRTNWDGTFEYIRSDS